MAEIFISYRRNDDRAEMVYHYLNRHLYPGAVYQDVHAGDLQQFRRSIEGQVRDCRLVLVILGEVFYSRMAELPKESDVVRLELLTALASGKPVLPVIVTNRTAGEFHWPEELGALDSRTRHYLSVWPQSQRPEDVRRELPRLLDAVKPHLPEYWRRKSRRLAIAAWALAALLGLGLLTLIAGGVWYGWLRSTMRDIDIVNVVRFEALPPDMKLDVKQDVSLVAQPFPPNAQQGDLARYDDWKLDAWLSVLVDGLGSKWTSKCNCRVFVLSTTFDRDHEAGVMRLRHQAPQFEIVASACFLVGKSREGPGPPRPVYRQLKLFREVSHTKSQPGLHAVELTRPRSGERLVLIVVLSNLAMIEWPGNEALGFKLEKSS